MDLTELVEAILSGDLLTARQWVADAYREHLQWETLGRPNAMNDRQLSVAAAVVELLASRVGALRRHGQRPLEDRASSSSWTRVSNACLALSLKQRAADQNLCFAAI